jgi:hypothetical protein
MLSVQKISSILILSHLLLLSSEIHAQQRNPIPLLPAEMTYQEYQDLNKEANWKRLIIAFFVPGYMHFYADAPAWGIAIATTRIIGGGMMAFATVDQYNYARSSNWDIDQLTGNTNRSEQNFYLFVGGLGLNMLAYGFDWGHADYLIEKRRTQIEYKYGRPLLDIGLHPVISDSYGGAVLQLAIHF